MYCRAGRLINISFLIGACIFWMQFSETLALIVQKSSMDCSFKSERLSTGTVKDIFLQFPNTVPMSKIKGSIRNNTGLKFLGSLKL